MDNPAIELLAQDFMKKYGDKPIYQTEDGNGWSSTWVFDDKGILVNDKKKVNISLIGVNYESPTSDVINSYRPSAPKSNRINMLEDFTSGFAVDSDRNSPYFPQFPSHIKSNGGIGLSLTIQQKSDDKFKAEGWNLVLFDEAKLFKRTANSEAVAANARKQSDKIKSDKAKQDTKGHENL